MEVELLDECVRLWSAGKETNIKILLSKLHHVRSLMLDINNLLTSSPTLIVVAVLLLLLFLFFFFFFFFCGYHNIR
jgi:hypothetical protein